MQNSDKTMENQIISLTIIQRQFQRFIKNPNLIYTYLAPTDPELFNKFCELVREQPTRSQTICEVLGDLDQVCNILVNNFPKETELETYIASKDTCTSLILKGTLRDYIKSENIDFDY